MRLPVLLVCVVWCGVVASQGQDQAVDPDYDYYGELGDAPLDYAGVEGELADYPIDEPAPTEAPKPTTTTAPPRRKLVSLRKTPRIRSGGSRRITSLTTKAPSAGSDAAPASTDQGTSGRGATTLRRRPSRRGTGTTATEPEVAEKPASTRAPSRRGRPSRTQTTSTSNGASSRRGISRSSSTATDTATEEPSSNSHRFAGRRTGSRRTSANTNTDPTEASATQPRFARRRIL